MSPTRKPSGYSPASLDLIGDGAHRTIAWLLRAVGAQELRRLPGSSGRLMHLEVA